MARKSHKARFNELQDQSLITRATMYANWTLPWLMADLSLVSGNQRAVLERDYQEYGALLTNNLASKLAQLLFPGHFPFFRIKPTGQMRKRAQQQGKEAVLDSNLAKLELDASKRVFRNASYAQLTNMLKYLIVTGSALVHRDKASGATRVWGLRSFGIQRDGSGRMLDCVLREFHVFEGLEPEIQRQLRAEDRSYKPGRRVEVYTRVQRRLNSAGDWYIEETQQVDTHPVGEVNKYPPHLCPWITPTWNLITGEHYGRGLVEDFAGGFAKLSNASEAAALYGIEIMRVIHLVAQGGGTDIDSLITAETGEYVRGDEKSITAHEAGDAQKLQQVLEMIQTGVTTLSRAFMYQGGTRDAERVTKYELERDAREAEFVLGGTYSILSQNVQVPLANLLIWEEDEEATLAALVTKQIAPEVEAGLPALGRSADVQNLLLAVQEIAAAANLVQLDPRADRNKVNDMIMASRSVDWKALQLSEQQQSAMSDAEEQLAAGSEQAAQATADADQLQNLQNLVGGTTA